MSAGDRWVAFGAIGAMMVIGLLASVCTPTHRSTGVFPSFQSPHFDWRAVFAGEPSDVWNLHDGLVVRVYKTGASDVPQADKGDAVEIEFVARYVMSDGTKTEFDSSAKRGGTLRVPLQEGAAVVGLLRGLEGLRVGDVARIEIPAEMGYGEAGRAPIPGNAALEFEVWVKAIEPT